MQYGPKVVTNGLVLGYDASDRNSCLPNSLINMNSWTVSGGSVTGYNQNGATAENQRFAAANPWGHTGIVWGTFPLGQNDADGGWNTTDFNILSSKNLCYLIFLFYYWLNFHNKHIQKYKYLLLIRDNYFSLQRFFQHY